MNTRDLRYTLVLHLAELDHKIGEQNEIIARATAERERLRHLHTTVEVALQKIAVNTYALTHASKPA